MLYNESPVYYYSVVTAILNYGNFCWGVVFGACGARASEAAEIPYASMCVCLTAEVSVWRLVAEHMVLLYYLAQFTWLKV